MKKNLTLIVLILLFTSCTTSKGLVSEFWDLMPQDINSFNSFLVAFLCVFCIQLLLSLISRLFIPLDIIIAIVLFVLVLTQKEYGFWITLLLFSVETLLIYGLMTLYKIYNLYKSTHKD